VAILVALVAVVGLWLLLRRANELCAIRIRNGDARLVRGRAPGRLLYDVAEIARRAQVSDAYVRVVSESGSPVAKVSGAVSEATVQQLRNVVGEHQVVHFRTGRRAGG
jgi:Protein of unknown function (DUF3634)